MRSITLLQWTLLAGAVSANPVRIDLQVDDVDIHVDIGNHNANAATRTGSKPSVLTSTKLPIVTLPYVLHQASPDTYPNQDYYNFSNIPYAKQPTGDRRFKKAETLPQDYVEKPELNDGQKSAICPQGVGGWFTFAQEFSGELFNPGDTLDKKWNKKITPSDYPPISQVPRAAKQDESCLLLDVYVKKSYYDDESNGYAPVIIWFHGGGFVFGSKNDGGGPSSILDQAAQFEDGNVVVVSVNYRLGAFGWLSGDEFREAGGFPNAGLSDQVEAIKWVKDNIIAFGGSPYQITLMGESAGASSILHHLTLYGGNAIGKRPPAPDFQQAILQSPAFFPIANSTYMKNTYEGFLEAAKAKDFKDLQSKDMADLIEANFQTIYQSPYGLFTYGPALGKADLGVDYVPAPPLLLLRAGFHWRGIQVMFANNRREGSIFTPPWLRDFKTVKEHLLEVYPGFVAEELPTFEKLYPVPQTLTTPKAKFLYSAAPFGDLGIDCNAWAVRQAYPNSYEYHYRLYPGFHGQDVGATWWPNAGDNLSKLNVKEQSLRLQRYLTSFAKYGNPNENKLADDENWPYVEENSDKSYMYIGDGLPRLPPLKDKSYGVKKDDPLPSKDTCEFWQSAPWWGEEPEMTRVLGDLLQVQTEL